MKALIGRFFTSKIRFKRASIKLWLFQPLFYALCLSGVATLPLYIFLHHRDVSADLALIEEDVESLEFLSHKMVTENLRRERFRQLYGRADPAYLVNHIETLVPLREEVELLKTIEMMPAFRSFEPIKRRLDFLIKGQNQPIFEEVDRRKSEGFVEVEHRLIHPVTLDLDDLRRLLVRVEGVEIGDMRPNPYRPQLFFKQFEIKRDKISENRESYQLNMELLTREIR